MFLDLIDGYIRLVTSTVLFTIAFFTFFLELTLALLCCSCQCKHRLDITCHLQRAESRSRVTGFDTCNMTVLEAQVVRIEPGRFTGFSSEGGHDEVVSVNLSSVLSGC